MKLLPYNGAQLLHLILVQTAHSVIERSPSAGPSPRLLSAPSTSPGPHPSHMPHAVGVVLPCLSHRGPLKPFKTQVSRCSSIKLHPAMAPLPGDQSLFLDALRQSATFRVLSWAEVTEAPFRLHRGRLLTGREMSRELGPSPPHLLICFSLCLTPGLQPDLTHYQQFPKCARLPPRPGVPMPTPPLYRLVSSPGVR